MIYEMNCKKNAFLLVMMLLFVSIMAHAQNISGKIIGKDGGAIPYASISYKKVPPPFQAAVQFM